MKLLLTILIMSALIMLFFVADMWLSNYMDKNIEHEIFNSKEEKEEKEE